MLAVFTMNSDYIESFAFENRCRETARSGWKQEYDIRNNRSQQVATILHQIA
jgi:hypothetical protein